MTFLPNFNNLWTSRQKGEVTSFIHQSMCGGSTLLLNMMAFLYEEDPNYTFAIVYQDNSIVELVRNFCFKNNLAIKLTLLNELNDNHNDSFDFVLFSDPHYNIEPRQQKDYLLLAKKINTHIIVQTETRRRVMDVGIHAFPDFRQSMICSTILSLEKNDDIFSVSLIKSRNSTINRKLEFNLHFDSRRFIPLTDKKAETFFNLTDCTITYTSKYLNDSFTNFTDFCSKNKLKLYIQEFLREKSITYVFLPNETLTFVNYDFIKLFDLFKQAYPKFDGNQFVNKMSQIKTITKIEMLNHPQSLIKLLGSLPQKLAYKLFNEDYFNDSLAMMDYILKKEPNYLIKKNSWKTLHDALELKSFQLQHIEHGENFLNLFLNEWHNKTVTVDGEELTLYIPQNCLEIFDFARTMHLCIRNAHYIKQVQENTLNFVIIKDSSNRNKYCFAFNNRKELVECKTNGNQLLDRYLENQILSELRNV